MADQRGKPVRATSDLHLTPRSEAWVFAALSELQADAQATKGHTFILGDVFSQGDVVDMRLWNRLRTVLQMWPAAVTVIPGNHDQYDGYRNCLEGLSGGSCRVINRPAWTTFGRVVPYTVPDQFEAAIKGIQGPPPVGEPLLPFMWAHHGFQGAYRNTMNRDSDGVSCAAIPDDVQIVVTGHYHMPQNLGPIIYCGSPYETTFAEEGQAKGWLRWDDPFSDPAPVRVPFGDLGAPRHYTIRWDPDAGEPIPPPGLREIDNVRVVTQATRKKAKEHAGQLARAGLAGAAIMARAERGSSRGIIRQGMTARQAAERYVIANADKMDPVAMDAFALETGLWDGIA